MRFAVPVFVTTKFWTALVAPTVTPPKLNDVGATAIPATGAPLAVPFSTMVYVVGVALAVTIVIVPVRAAGVALVGLKVMLRKHSLSGGVPFGRFADPKGQLDANKKSPAEARLVISNGADPVFASVTVCGALVVPTICAPNVSGPGGVSVTMGIAAAEIVMLKACEPVPPALVAAMVALKVPAAVGVPLITPVVAFTASPAGSPFAEKVTGVLVPVMVYENGVPTTPLAVVGLVMTGAAAAIEKPTANGALVPLAFVAVTEMLKLPAAVGVPDKMPVVALNVVPVGGTPVSAKLVGELVAVI